MFYSCHENIHMQHRDKLITGDYLISNVIRD